MQLEIPEASEAVACPLCGGRDGAVVAERGRFDMPVRNLCCGTCATVYVTPRPSAEAMAAYYRSTYRKHYGAVGYIGADGKRAAPGDAGYEEALLLWHRPQANNALALSQAAPGASVLEIGCRHGKTLELMRERGGIIPFGIEPGEAEAEQARAAGVDCFTGALEAFEPGARRFDHVQWFHVLEHVHQPLEALLRVRSWLAPHGTLLIEVPNVYQPYGLLEENFFQNVHLVSYSPQTLPALVRRAGFEVTRVVDAGTLFVLARPAASSVDLPLPFAPEQLGAEPHSVGYVATRLGNYANLERLWQWCQQGASVAELTEPLLRSLKFPAFPEHMLKVCAEFINRLVATGHVEHALAVTLAVAHGPHPPELRAKFRDFAERLGGTPQAIGAQAGAR